MHRRRSALTVSAAVALCAVVPLLSACGSESHPGAAAVVDGDRISMSQLQSRVGAVRDAQSAEPKGEEMIERSGRLTQATLDGMIRDRIVQRAAQDAGVSVSRRAVQKARAAFEKQTGGAKEFRSVLLQQQAVAPSEVDAWVRMQLTVERIAQARGINPRSPEGNKALTDTFSKTSEEMDIDINPRYGDWDTKRSALAPKDTPWLNDVSGKQADRQQPA